MLGLEVSERAEQEVEDRIKPILVRLEECELEYKELGSV